MVLKTELDSAKQEILIITKLQDAFTEKLKQYLKRYDYDVFISPYAPKNLDRFNVWLVINQPDTIDTLLPESNGKKIAFLFTNKSKAAASLYSFVEKQNRKNIRVINVEHPESLSSEELENILWFTFGRNNEIFLNITSLKTSKNEKKAGDLSFVADLKAFQFSLSAKKVLVGGGILLFLFHLLFIPPLLLASYYHLKAASSLVENDMTKADNYIEKARRSLDISNALFSPVRPTYLLLAVIVAPDHLFQLNEATNESLKKSLELTRIGSTIGELMFKKDKTPEEKIQLLSQLKLMEQDLLGLEENLTIIYQKMPTWNTQLTEKKQLVKETITTIDTFKKFFPHLPTLFAHNGQKDYLLLFANNMEMRPGGGFIGSFATLTIKDWSITNLKVYDVYDADGQLKAHVPPPKPIEKYLQQPHWFLRDSAFSPDFYENYNQALSFLQKEMGFNTFDGGILFTTTAIQNVLSGVGNLYIPDFKENVNKDNFYLKAQLYAEKDFFPGSQQKKRFLSSVLNQLLINMNTFSVPRLTTMMKKSLDEKQMVVYVRDANVQRIIDGLYWSGRTITPTCATQTKNCIVDFVFPFDANLGVNKANFFVNKALKLDVKIAADGTVSNTVTVTLHNNAVNEVFPGGTYKNYAQFMLPLGVTVRTITKNDTLVEEFDESSEQLKTIGFFLEIKPQSTAIIKIHYDLPQTLQKGQGAYQIIIQKQIGSPNSDLDLTLSLSKNVYMVNQNFSPLVKDNKINYNTTLTSDKIIFIDLIRE